MRNIIAFVVLLLTSTAALADSSGGSPRNPVSSPSSWQFSPSNDTCMGATASGAQGIGFGFSFGGT